MKRITGKTAKNKSKKNIKLIIIGMIVVFVVALISIRLLPTVRSVDITIEAEDKNSKITKEQVMAMSNLKVGDKLYKNLRSEIEKNIEENPYIESAKVERDISGKVKIKVEQREPAYMINYAGEYIYIDDEGYILEVNSQNNGTPVIIGFTTDFSELSMGNTKIRLNQKDIEKLEIVNNIISTLVSNNVENTVNSIDVTDNKNFILHLDEDGKSVYIGDGTDLNTKVLYMKKILEAESGHTGIIYMNGDLDEGYVYFKEQ